MALSLSGTDGIVTGNIKPLNITTATIADDNVTTAKILNANVTPAKLSQPMTLGTVVNVSGTSVDFTGIPSWIKKITVSLSGVSTSGTSVIELRLGSSSGVEATGYIGCCFFSQANSVGNLNLSSGFMLDGTVAATNSRSGTAIFSLITGNLWAGIGNFGCSDINRFNSFAGSKTVSGGTLDRISLTTVNGTDTFDAGSVNIMYEG